MARRHSICPPQPGAPPTDSSISFDEGPRNVGGAQLLLRLYTRTKYDPAGTFDATNVSAVLFVSKFARFNPPGELPAWMTYDAGTPVDGGSHPSVIVPPLCDTTFKPRGAAGHDPPATPPTTTATSLDGALAPLASSARIRT